jgi:hypothetical protein
MAKDFFSDDEALVLNTTDGKKNKEVFVRLI